MASLVWFFGFGVVLPLILVVLAFRSPFDHQVQRWAASAGVVVTPTNEAQIRARLGRGRRFRAVAALPFWWLLFAPAVFTDFPRAVATFFIPFGAYVLGALVAELTWTPEPASGVRRAPLVSRNADDYEPGWIRVLPWMLLSLAVLALTVGASSDGNGPLTSDGAAALVLAVAFTLLGELTVRRVVARPQPGADPDELAADDALRATGVALARSVGILAALQVLSAAMRDLLPEDGGWWVLAWLPFEIVVFGMTVATLSVVIRQETWGHRRRFRQPAVAAPA